MNLSFDLKMKYSSTLAAFMLLILVVSTSEATLSCSDVIKDLKPCISYLVSGSGKPPEACCIGAKALASSATNSEDKKAACNCIKSTAKSITLNSQLAQSLPGNCGISLSITISPNADCSKFG
ncbi:putative plant lipid transfer protein/Par allergen [Lupinus albus]|uniref:Non-specific lipid-transfer protein n=1 Tax=Lupinus albus TaxID=3870 RepID=A0A6A4NVD7_LUPAL|nr:putative plant lipid transfer protein/Par allergen [Lupinus albus]